MRGGNCPWFQRTLSPKSFSSLWLSTFLHGLPCHCCIIQGSLWRWCIFGWVRLQRASKMHLSSQWVVKLSSGRAFLPPDQRNFLQQFSAFTKGRRSRFGGEKSVLSKEIIYAKPVLKEMGRKIMVYYHTTSVGACLPWRVWTQCWTFANLSHLMWNWIAKIAKKGGQIVWNVRNSFIWA